MNVAQLLLHYLGLEEARYLFGVPGAAIKTLLKELRNREDFHYIVCRHESGAAYMADGYYRATGRPGVVAVTSGPGATNALTGVLTADSGGSAVIAITGEISERAIGLGYLQEGIESALNIPAIYTAATRYSAYLTDPSSAKTLIQQALREAMSTPRHAIHLSLPENIAFGDVPDNYPQPLPTKPEQYRTTVIGGIPCQSDVKKACDAIQQSNRPLIFLGNGCRNALRDPSTKVALRKLVETYAIPVMTTADGKGLFPENDFYSLRSYGCASCRWPYELLKDHRCDTLLVIGTALGNLSTNWWLPMLIPSRQFIHVDIDPSVLGRAFNITQGIVADAGEFIRSLSDAVLARSPDPAAVTLRKGEIEKIKHDVSPFVQQEDYEKDREHTPNHWSDYNSRDDTNGIEPAALIRIVQEVLDEEDRDTMLFIDAGNCVGWGAHYFVVKDKIEYNGDLRMSPMGFAVAGVIGAKLGKNTLSEDFDCIALVGDGAFLMHGAEVSTASALHVGAIWIVLAENDLRMVSQGMSWWTRDNFDRVYTLGDADLVKFAEGLGANSVQVKTQSQLKDALRNALQASRGVEQMPQAIIARINAERFPPYYVAPYTPPIQRTVDLARSMLLRSSP